METAKIIEENIYLQKDKLDKDMEDLLEAQKHTLSLLDQIIENIKQMPLNGGPKHG